ncbi:MAG: chemotaxis protein CheA [Planctomycetota bacterium]
MSHDDFLLEDFLAESSELLDGVASEVQTVLDTGDTTPLHRVFRAVHTVKGTAGFLGLLNVKNFAHRIEDVLDRLRSGKLHLSRLLATEITHCVDLLSRQIPRSAMAPPTPDLLPDEVAAIERLTAAASADEDNEANTLRRLAETVERVTDPAMCMEAVREILASWRPSAAESPVASEDDGWPSRAAQLQFLVQGKDLSAEVTACLPFFNASKESRLTDAIAEEFLAACKSLSARLVEIGARSTAALVDALADECRVIHESPIDLDDFLVSNILDQFEKAIGPFGSTRPPSKPTDTSNNAPEKLASPPRPAPQATAGTVRVRESVLDQFIWHVGETLLALELYRDLQNRLNEANAPAALLTEFNELNRELTVSVGRMQQSAMDIRRVPISSLLNKVPTMVRQLAPELGKEVSVEIFGGECKVDKSLIQELDGPMTHLVRNALDHGLDPPEERVARGRPAVGTLRIECRTERDSLVLDIRDDGRGIHPDRVLRKALDRGVVSQAQAPSLTREEIFQLLCRPGFSTAEKVSDISGRGVGLDVVASTVQRNRGTLAIESIPGQGTQFTMRFPLRGTVLMVDGLLCESSGRFAAFDVDFVHEVVRIEPDMIKSVMGHPTAVIRNTTYPVHSLDHALGMVRPESAESSAAPGSHGVILVHRERKILLTVDRLLGYRKMVLKNFDRSLAACELLTGVAQLGGSKLALVFDVPELLSRLNGHAIS